MFFAPVRTVLSAGEYGGARRISADRTLANTMISRAVRGRGGRAATAPVPAAPDGALNALVAAWSARRWAGGAAEVLGGEADPSTGRPMRMIV